MAVSFAHDLARPALLELIANGQLHSGEALAAALGVSRAAVWKGVERLRAQGIPVLARARSGYQLAAPVELLAEHRIRAALGAPSARSLRRLELLFQVDSTNSRLAAVPPPPYGCADVCLSELQSAGRGRRGRRWLAPFGTGITMSAAWSFREAHRDLPALSLGVGVAVARALTRAGGAGVRLKWPNDIWYEDRKLGGILIELRAEAGGPAHVVIGVGVNVEMPAQMRRQLEADTHCATVAAVAELCREPPSRNQVAGLILDELLGTLVQFEREGFAPLRDAWSALDALQGRATRVIAGERALTGTARGVDVDGALLVEIDGRMQKFVSGEVSLRLEGQPV
jgi:BirA family biotin operon repressor/biotin-[acetyl-CoA-carboxylase] ligase